MTNRQYTNRAVQSGKHVFLFFYENHKDTEHSAKFGAFTGRTSIARLASRLQEEAHGIVEESKSRYERQLKELSDRCAALTQEAGRAAYQQKALELRLDETNEQLTAKSETCDALDKKLNKATQRDASMTALLKEKQAHIESLEEKHRHSREALEHYRESVKEQRDQDEVRPVKALNLATSPITY